MAVLLGEGDDPLRYNAEEDFDLIHAQLVPIVKRLFSGDTDIQKLNPEKPLGWCNYNNAVSNSKNAGQQL
jgi:hypothetical protein